MPCLLALMAAFFPRLAFLIVWLARPTLVAAAFGNFFLWPLLGIANQLLAVTALCVGTTFILNEGRARYAWVTAVPLAWVTTTTMTAGVQLIERYLKDTKPGASLRLVLVVVMLGCVLLVLGDSARACWRKLKT